MRGRNFDASASASMLLALANYISEAYAVLEPDINKPFSFTMKMSTLAPVKSERHTDDKMQRKYE